MPRLARVVVPGVPHHITQRGNNRQDVFFGDDDRRAYLALLRAHAEKYGLGILGYSLMTNHVHLVVVPAAPESLAKGVGRTHFRYTQRMQHLHDWTGHLWTNRFFSCPTDEAYCWAALRYVELNPVRAGLVASPWEYPWSSAAAHCAKATDPLLDLTLWQGSWTPARWQAWLARGTDEAELAALRASTHTGRPLGESSFIARLEEALSRRLHILPGGRPRKRKPSGN